MREIRELSRRYGIPIRSDADACEAKFALKLDADGLCLEDLGNPRLRPIRMETSNVRPLARKNAFGFALGKSLRTVIDATAGLGGDALLMARMGYQVIAFERCAPIAALLEDGARRANALMKTQRIATRHGDAGVLMRHEAIASSVVYLDPMFPPGRKASVKVSRRLEILRELCGDSDNAGELLEAALAAGSPRIVIKRPSYASPVRPERLSGSFAGKLVRYDVYQQR